MTSFANKGNHREIQIEPGATGEVWEWHKYFHPTPYNGCNYLSMLRFKLIHVKGSPCY